MLLLLHVVVSFFLTLALTRTKKIKQLKIYYPPPPILFFSLFPGTDRENTGGGILEREEAWAGGWGNKVTGASVTRGAITKENLWNGRSSDFSNQVYSHQHDMTWKEKGTDPENNGIRHSISSIRSPCSADVRAGWYNYRRLDGEKEKKVEKKTGIKTEKMKKKTTPRESHGVKGRYLGHSNFGNADSDSNGVWYQSYIDKQPVEDILANDCKKRKMATDANTPDCPVAHGGDTSVKATCSDEDGSCFDGDDMWNCAGMFYCSNDGADYAKKLGGILCPNQNRRRANHNTIKKDDMHAHTANNAGTASRGAISVAHGPILNAGTRFYNCMSGFGNMYYDQAGWNIKIMGSGEEKGILAGSPVSEANRFYHGREQLIYGITFFVLIFCCCLCPWYYDQELTNRLTDPIVRQLLKCTNNTHNNAQEASKVLKSKDFTGAKNDIVLTDDSEFVAVEMVDFTDSHSTSVQEVE